MDCDRQKPKQYYLINGKELIWYTIEAFKQAKKIDEEIVIRAVSTSGFKKILFWENAETD